MDDWTRLLDDALADERLVSRRRERALRTVDRESATLAGAFVDLAEAAGVVRIASVGGRSYVGPVRLAAADFAVVGDAWIAYRGIRTVRPVESAVIAAGDRTPVDLRLVEALGRVVDEQPRVALEVVGGEVVSGILQAVGADVVTLRPDGDGGVVYIPSSSTVAAFRSG